MCVCALGSPGRAAGFAVGAGACDARASASLAVGAGACDASASACLAVGAGACDASACLPSCGGGSL
jgi:hypothetical protein